MSSLDEKQPTKILKRKSRMVKINANKLRANRHQLDKLHSLIAGGILLVAPGCCPLPPVDMGIDAVGLPQNRNEQLKLKAEIERLRNNPREAEIIWKGTPDDAGGLQAAIEKFHFD